ncbi:MAG: glucose-6-phosphate dehydrogenase assembly protein OpcA [Verrucomicrobiales bacterium]|nr:glucose-6-phosphate dehydrogenase assembly protein OpcA [Verrucomicrobiales bacterium]
MTASTSLDGTELLGFPVSIKEIDQRLTEVISGGSDGGEDSGVTRASLMNLALYSERPEQLTENAETIAEITREAACRTILICVDPAEKVSSAKAWVQAHCQSDKHGNKSVCSEQISFFLTGTSPGLVNNIVFSHLDSDLPLVFWWRGEFSDAFGDELYSRIDRFIFDSEAWANPRNQFVRLSDACKSGRAQFLYHDLAYTRLNTHRQAIANVFDIPALRNQVSQIEGMKIRYPKGRRMSAIYLSAWLAQRLNGVLERGMSSSGHYVFRSSKPGFPNEITVSTEEVDSPDFAAAIKVGDQLVELTRCEERDYLRTKIIDGTSGDSTEDWLPNPRKNDAELVTQILERGGKNRSLSKIVEGVGEMLTV